jgi:hypothetical protein
MQDDPLNTYLVGLALSELDAIERSCRFFAELFGMEPLREFNRKSSEAAMSSFHWAQTPRAE